MNRRIEFRGKDAVTGKWVYGHLLHHNPTNSVDMGGKDMNTYYIIPTRFDITNLRPIRVITETVGEFTGLYDKNDNEIFEGDIIETITFGFDAEKFTSVIEFKKCSFLLSSGRNIFYCGQKDCNKMDDSRVIGNIYDNKNLINK